MIQEERLDQYLKEALPLMISNNQEVNLFGRDLDPDFEAYYALEQNNALKSYILRDQGELVGYCLILLYDHLHHRGMKCAQLDMIYVKPSHRLSGIKLLRYTEEALTKEGVDVFLQGAPGISRLGGILEKMKYNELETIYIKDLR